MRSFAIGRLVPAFSLVIAACGTTPPERVHSLLGAESSVSQPQTAFVFALSPVRLPPGVDGPQWLVGLPDGTLARLEQDRWAASLREELRAALADQLVRRGGVEARTAPGAPAATRIDLDVRRFETVPGRGVRMSGTVTLVAPPTGSTRSPAGVRCPYEHDEAETGGTPALAAAHRRMVGDLADRIAAGLRAGPGCG